MELDKILKLKPYTKLLGGFGVITLALGFSADKLPKCVEKWELENIHKHLPELVLAAPYVLTLGIFKIIDQQINEQIDKKVQEDLKEQVEQEKSALQSSFLSSRIERGLVEIRKRVEDLNISEELRLEISDHLEEAKESFSGLRGYVQASEDLVFWLDTSEMGMQNRQNLLEHTLESVQADTVFTEYLRQDLRQCINWIHDCICSICRSEADPLEPPERYISAHLAGMPNSISQYNIALQVIKARLQELEAAVTTEKASLPLVLDDVLEALSRRLEAAVEAHTAAQLTAA